MKTVNVGASPMTKDSALFISQLQNAKTPLWWVKKTPIFYPETGEEETPGFMYETSVIMFVAALMSCASLCQAPLFCTLMITLLSIGTSFILELDGSFLFVVAGALRRFQTDNLGGKCSILF